MNPAISKHFVVYTLVNNIYIPIPVILLCVYIILFKYVDVNNNPCNPMAYVTEGKFLLIKKKIYVVILS